MTISCNKKFGKASFMIFGIFVLFYFAECAAGSCLSYGHACWGGHGKRSDSHISNRIDADMSMLPRWHLSRLIQKPLNRRYIFGSRSDGVNVNDIFRNDENIKSLEDSEINELMEGQNDNDVIIGNGEEPRILEKRALGHN